MSETDEELARDVKQVVAKVVGDRPLPRVVLRRIRHRRRLLALGGVGAIAAALALLWLALATLLPMGGGPPYASVSPATEPASLPPVVTHGSEGVQITIPSSWTFDNGADMTMIDPKILFVAGSWNFPTRGDCAPNAALDSLPTDGVLLWLIEYTSPNTPVSVPPRPDQMELGPLVGPIECVGTSAHVIGFEDAGRVFQMYVVFGSDVSSSPRQEAVDALNSIVVQPAAGPSGSGQ